MSDNKGWECPKCERVYGPHVDECKYCSSGLAGLPELPKLPELPQLPRHRPIWVDPWWYYYERNGTFYPPKITWTSTGGDVSVSGTMEVTGYTLIN